MGRLCVPYQPDPSARLGADANRTILSPDLRGLLHCLLPGHYPVHADLFCRISGRYNYMLIRYANKSTCTNRLRGGACEFY